MRSASSHISKNCRSLSVCSSRASRLVSCAGSEAHLLRPVNGRLMLAPLSNAGARSASRKPQSPGASWGLNDATNTHRFPESTVCPACITAPPKSIAVPAGGRSTNVGSSGLGPVASSVQNAVPPPTKSLHVPPAAFVSAPFDSGIRIVRLCLSSCGWKPPPAVYIFTAGSPLENVSLEFPLQVSDARHSPGNTIPSYVGRLVATASRARSSRVSQIWADADVKPSQMGSRTRKLRAS
eukprot:6665465-Prymnesium_polylepis.1